MKVWVIRGKFSDVPKKEFIENYDEEMYNRHHENDKEGDYKYWTRKSTWEKKEIASIQTNVASAKRAFKRAKDRAAKSYYKWIMDVEMLELELPLPGGVT